MFRYSSLQSFSSYGEKRQLSSLLFSHPSFTLTLVLFLSLEKILKRNENFFFLMNFFFSLPLSAKNENESFRVNGLMLLLILCNIFDIVSGFQEISSLIFSSIFTLKRKISLISNLNLIVEIKKNEFINMRKTALSY